MTWKVKHGQKDTQVVREDGSNVVSGLLTSGPAELLVQEHNRAESLEEALASRYQFRVDEHLRHMSDGAWHDDCGYCIARRLHGGTGIQQLDAEHERAETLATKVADLERDREQARAQRVQVNIAREQSARAEREFYNGQIDALKVENDLLRYLLWLRHGHDGLYGDDGEMQCPKCRLDYKRDPVKHIVERYIEDGKRVLAAQDKPVTCMCWDYLPKPRIDCLCACCVSEPKTTSCDDLATCECHVKIVDG